MSVILNELTSFSNPLIFQFTDTVNLNVVTSFKCWCLYSNSSQWTINKINPVTGKIIKATAFPASVNSTNTSNLILPLNGTLAYGVYQLVYQSIMTSPVNQYLSNASAFIKVLPEYFNVLGFDSGANLTVGPFDSILFTPPFYSFDPNNVISPLTLNYQYYCILMNATSKVQPNNFNQSVYSIQPNVELTSEQINTPDTCFKSSSIINCFDSNVYTYI